MKIYDHVCENSRAVLEETFKKYLMRNGQSLKTFLTCNKQDIFSKTKGYLKGRSVRNMLYRNAGVASTLDNCDLLTLCFILTHFCSLGPNLEGYLKMIKDTRNELSHMPWPQLSEEEYKKYDSEIKCCMSAFINYVACSEFGSKMGEQIRTTDKEPLDMERYNDILTELENLRGTKYEGMALHVYKYSNQLTIHFCKSYIFYYTYKLKLW